MDAPQYQQPPLDPAYALLMQQSQQQDIKALSDRTANDTALNRARYGASVGAVLPGGAPATAPGIPAPGDNAGLLARYSMQLIAAGAGGMPKLG